MRIGVELLDLGEQRLDKLHRLVVALHEDRRCPTGHGDRYLCRLAAALNKKVIDWVRRTSLKRHPSHWQLRGLGPAVSGQHAGQVDRRYAMRERNATTASCIGA